MATKFIFVTGGVVSGLGKGITAAALGRLLKARGLQVRSMKMDPYLNVDPGRMNPTQHGEVFVTEDGAETDLDLGHYERFIDENLTRNSTCTSGTVYATVLQNELDGAYNGKTVQVIPHITNEAQRRISLNDGADVVLVEIGGTVGDIESQPFLEAIRQFSLKHGRSNCMFIHVTLLPYISASKELKTKPTQHSVKELLNVGISPDVIICRSEYPMDDDLRSKIALFCNVPEDCVIENRDVPCLYEVPLALEKQRLADIVIRRLGIVCGSPELTDWVDMVNRRQKLSQSVTISLVGKYIELHDSYLSVVESLTHAGIACGCNIEIDWVDSGTVTRENVHSVFAQTDGILVPGGFGERGIPGMVLAAGYARTHAIPYLGISLGLQVACIEFARNVLGLPEADSTEFNPLTPDPVFVLTSNEGGEMRLGQYPCVLKEGSVLAGLYGRTEISERHRHRYEFNNKYREAFDGAGMRLVGYSPDGTLAEMAELEGHPFFAGTQAHPEFKSRPNRAHPLFVGFVRAVLG